MFKATVFFGVINAVVVRISVFGSSNSFSLAEKYHCKLPVDADLLRVEVSRSGD